MTVIPAHERGLKKMIARTWIALAIGVAVLMGGFSVVSALGAMNGDCDQTQDKLQLKDGSCEECPDCPTDEAVEVVEESTEEVASEVGVPGDGICDSNETADDDITCDSCLDYLYLYLYLNSFLYNETDEEPPHQSECGQE